MKTAAAFAALAFVLACIIATQVEALVSQMLPAGTIHP